MQIVIDIPDYDYSQIKEYYEKNDTVEATYSYIYHGTPLPKGHGRLIDYGYVVDAIDDWVNAEEYRYTNATDYLRKRVENVPTIIEADKAERGDKE